MFKPNSPNHRSATVQTSQAAIRRSCACVSSSSRQGITLLFVVSMIVLFLLMGTAFVVLAGDFMKSSKARVRKEINIVEGTELVDRAFYDLIREPDLNDLSSPLRFVGLLSDMYGYGFRGTVVPPTPQTAAVTDAGGQFIIVDLINPNNLLDGTPVINTAAVPPVQPVDFEWGGLILTWVKGEQSGLSARIVRHEIVAGSTPLRHRLTLSPEPGNTEYRTTADLTQLTSNGTTNLDNVIVNRRPFAGTGTNSAQQNLGGIAVSPAATSPLFAAGGPLALPGASGGVNHAASNEPFDAYDAGNQNIFLAAFNPNGTVRESSFLRAGASGRSFVAIDKTSPTIIPPLPPDQQYRLVDNTNSGQPDGIWMDLGYPARYSPEGIQYKPFFSFTVVDLDGRMNVNFHGNLYSANQQMTARPVAVSSISNRGSGYGVAEIDLNLLFPNSFMQLLQGNGTFSGRYGQDGLPGQAGVRDAWSIYKLSGLPYNPLTGTPPGTIGREYGSAQDIHGRFSIGYPTDLTDVWNPLFNIGLPCTNVATSMLPNETADSAYEYRVSDATFTGPRRSGGLDDDRPFQALELERILRRHDIDVNVLPPRLLQLVGSDLSQAANSMTTHSFEVPTLYENLPRKLAEILTANGVPSATLMSQVETMLASEILRGLPMNINRPLPDGLSRPHPNGTDYPYTAATWVDYHRARYDYARHLYVLVLLCTEKVDRDGNNAFTQADLGINLLEYRRQIAQWAINVVDFRDNDTVMSSFELDLDPWDGWDVDGRLDIPVTAAETAIGADRFIVWGAERPELLITETFASHDRRTEDTTRDPSNRNTGNGDNDYDSGLIPNVSFLAELYNPWVIDDANQDRVPELWRQQGSYVGVDLQKTSPNGTPVWRMVVTENTRPARSANPDDPSFNFNANIIRRIYFSPRTNPSGANDLDFGQENKVYFPDSSIRINPVQRGRYAVVGSYVVNNRNDYITYFGRRRTANPLSAAELALTRRFVMDPAAETVKRYVWNTVTSQLNEQLYTDVVCLPIGQTFTGTRNLGISDPVNGYVGALPANLVVQPIADGLKFFDTATSRDHYYDTPLDITANTQVQFDGVDPNAERTVHLQRLANPLANYDPISNPYLTIDSSPVNLMAFNGAEDSTNEGITPQGNLGLVSLERESAGKNLFRNTFSSPAVTAGAPVVGDQHLLSFEFDCTFGRLNDKYLADANPNPFAWLTWNNRPYVSQYELVNVPYQPSYFLTRSFSLGNGTNVYAPMPGAPNPLGLSPIRGHFDHLFNFYADQFSDGTFTPNLYRVLDFTEVPSRFVGTERFLNPANYSPPFDTISSYRYPGKLNLNTVMGNPGGPSLIWNSLMRNYQSQFLFPNWENSRSSFPLRPSAPINTATNPSPRNSTLFRDNGSGTPLLDFSSTDPFNNSQRNAYFRYDARQRLGNLVTGRSSVFAIWITVGYFEIEDNGRPTNANLGGVELGSETGEVKRHRGFYIFDRSIPVAFEPGKNHNIENAILVRRIIQ